MTFAKRALILLFIMGLCSVSMGAVHWVGGFAGWTIAPGSSAVNYRRWAYTRNFHVGDLVVFRYNNKLHNVVRVTHQNFKSCNTTSPIAVYSSGSDTIRLTSPGRFFFICGLPGHCEKGLKVHIKVSRLPHENLPSLAAIFNDQSPHDSASVYEALAPGPVQSNAPSPSDIKISFSFCLVVLALGGVLAFGFGVTGISY